MHLRKFQTKESAARCTAMKWDAPEPSPGRCSGITAWGITDKYSWRGEETPLFDGNYQRKEAYEAVLHALNAA